MSGIEATAAELRSIARSATDATGYFAAMYAVVTGRIARSISAGEFVDGDRMDRFVSTFAGAYTRAARSPADRPRCWQASWNVAGDASLLIVQHLLLGINAHVNYDLALSVVDVADQTGDLASIRPDFDAVNAVLASTQRDVLGRLDRVSRWTNVAAGVGGGRAFNFSLDVARRQPWQAAERLYPLDAEGRDRYRQQLDQLVSVLAYLITRPSGFLRPALWLARRAEQHEPTVVVDALLDDE
jgi:hypothetical protein